MNNARQPITIAVLLQDLEFGGTQQYALRLLKHMDRAKFSPELWVLRGGDDMAALAAETGVNVVRFSDAKTVTPFALAHLAWRLFRSRPQILYTLTVVPNIWGRLLGTLARVPVIVSGYRSLFPRQWERLLWRLSDKIICNADALKEIMVRQLAVAPERIAVIPNSVDTDHFRPEPAAKAAQPTVVFVGRLVAEKDPMNLLEAFRLAAQRLPRAQFEIIGGGPFQPEMEARIRACSLESSIKLLPAIADIRPALRKAWVFALASASEASPNVIIEAMAAGLPVVATHVGGIPELVEDGTTGLLVEPGNPARLAETIVALLTDEERRRTMGEKGRERVLARHSIQTMVSQTEQVLLEAARP
ncbi:MAG: glycosyltransferase [Verrucomicrobia bacterium]|nr:glycosyltransferase [Verrucomicrobiota bacterium]